MGINQDPRQELSLFRHHRLLCLYWFILEATLRNQNSKTQFLFL